MLSPQPMLSPQRLPPKPSPTPDPSLIAHGWFLHPDNIYRDFPYQEPTPTPTQAPRVQRIPPSGTRPAIDNNLEQNILPITRKYGIPDALAASQYAAEGRGTHKYAVAPYNNPYNIGAFDSNPDAARRYATIEEGVAAYAQLLRDDPRYKFDPTADLMTTLNNVASIYAGDPATYAQRANNGYNTYKDFLMATPEWRQYSR